MGKGQLIVISGPSGAGKGTICKEYIRRHPDTFLSVSVTERAPRTGEENGVHYHFISHKEFDSLIENNGLVEWAQYGENRYGSPKKPMVDAMEQGRDVILEIEVVGAEQVKSHYPQGIYVFIAPPSIQELKSRLTGRNTESTDQIARRMAKAAVELGKMDRYNFIVVNKTVDAAVDDIEKIIAAEKLSTANQIKAVREALNI